jgi:hypothetical protein
VLDEATARAGGWRLPEVAAALPVSTAHVRVGGARVGVDGIDPGPAARVLDYGIRAGSLRALGRPGGGLLSRPGSPTTTAGGWAASSRSGSPRSG